jgi:hypothetical protein
MPFEETNKKIIEAAENHHPAYHEKAWVKMNLLLDKHMPEEKKKRRGAFLLLFLLVAGGAIGYLVFTGNGNNNNKETVAKTNTPAQPADKVPGNDNEKTNSLPTTISSQNNNELTPVENNSLTVKPLSTVAQPTSLNKNQSTALQSSLVKRSKPTRANEDQQNNSVADVPVTQSTIQNPPVNPDPSINKSKSITQAPSSEPAIAKNTAGSEKEGPSATANNIATTQKVETPVAETKKAAKSKTRKGNGLFISLSAGPDVGAIGGNMGKLKTNFGLGLGYAFNDKVSLQTGFYTSRKIYTAGPGDYNPPSWVSIFYPNFEKVDANCKVYEIPLLVNYNFSTNKKRSWSGTFGLSSYLMKTEDYEYYYKTGTQISRKHWVYNNENKHYFSVITLAGGYERKFNKNFSVSANPYLKLPWQGVGFGKVKLNSTGILISANIKPFAK